MNILRLSLFNLRKNRKEAVATAFLTMITTLMLAIFIADSAKINSGYDDSFAASGCYHYYIGVKDETYRDEYRTMLENSSGVHNVTEVKQLLSVATDVEKDGDILSYNLMFVTEKTEKKIENYIIRESLSDEKVKGLGHPIWLPVRFKISEGYDLGDTFTIVKYGIKYPFEIAGFYECGLVNDNGYGFKCIVSGADYALFSMILNSRAEGEFTALWFDCDYDFSINEFAERCSESSHENIEADMIFSSFTKEKENSIRFINLLLYFLAFFSVITMLSALFVTMHRINDDIEDQMQNIGALEALGYRSREISLAYVGEYLITGGIGSVLGAVVSVFVSPLMDSGVQIMMGRTVSSYADIAGTIIAAVIVTVLVIAIALLKAAKVRKYPPVTALRKGIGTHHFGRNIMPLEKSKGNINIALAAKSFIGDLRSSFGVAVCVIAASIAIFFCVNFFDFFKDGIDGLITLCGADLTVNVELMSGVDPEKVKEEIEAMPEVRKALVHSTELLNYISVKDSENRAWVQYFDDYSDAENIVLIRGRFPEHDNEIMITVARCRAENLDIGDSIVLKGNGVENKYLITGVTSSMMNNSMGVYLTTDGYLRTDFNVHPNAIAVYLADSVDQDMFEERLNDIYGKSVKDCITAPAAEGSLEERIRSEADKKLAALVSYYGVTNADYAVVAGDSLITGSSRDFVIKNVSSLMGMARQSMEPISAVTRTGSGITVIVIAFVVAVILGLIVSAAVKKQRKNLGIMKGLGYSSKDLMTQLALRTMPVTVVSVTISAVLTYFIYNTFWLTLFGCMGSINIPLTVITAIALIIFCYTATYICAGKVKAISVTELMTE